MADNRITVSIVMWDPLKILIIDDDAIRRGQCQALLEFVGETCIAIGSEQWRPSADDLQQYLAIFLGQPFNCKPEDLTLEAKAILEVVKSRNHHVPVVLLRNIEQARLSAFHEVILGECNWPFSQEEIISVLHRCQIARGNVHAAYYQPVVDSNYPMLIGNSKCMMQVRKLVAQVSNSDATVLITGESGTGKEVVARQIHDQSARREGPFVPVNCGAIPAELLESELFGHEKGAFTGAIAARQGRFELAKGGTLFLDEVGDMPLNMQVKLLRVIQERTFERVGSAKALPADVRILTATNRDLEEEIKQGNFREDLYYRINVFPIELPTLAKRAEDIPLLINDFLAKKTQHVKGTIRLMPRALQALQQYSWPGNIRELVNMIERLSILYPHGMIDKKDLPKKFHDEKAVNVPPQEDFYTEQQALFAADSEEELTIFEGHLPEQGINLKEALHEIELNYIRQALQDTNGVVAHAAEMLKMRRTTLVEKMRKYGLGRNDHATPLQ